MRSVLVVSGGGFQGLGLLEALQRIPDVKPLVADIHPDNVTRYLCPDYFVIPPVADRAAFTAAIRQLVAEHDVKAIYPSTARELPLLAELSASLAKDGVSMAVSESDLIGILLDKKRTAEYLREHDLPTQTPVDPLAHDYATALLGKPRFGWGGVGIFVAASHEEAARHAAVAAADSIVWVPFIDKFEEFSADFAIASPGRISPIVLRKRIRTSGGYAVISESVRDTELRALAGAAARSLSDSGGRGIFNIQMIRPFDGKTFVSDVNPRFGTSAVHGLSEGVNIAAFFMDPSSTHAEQSETGVKTIRYLKTLALPRIRDKPKALVFDLDDTLVDHKMWMAVKLEGAYRAVACDWIDAKTFRLHALQLVDEGERSHLIDRIAEHFSWTPTQRDGFLAAYRAATAPETPLFSDVSVLAQLAQAGFKLAVLTDNPPATQKAKIDNAEALGLLSAAVYARDTGAEKPSPEAFAAVADALSLPPQDLWMVGDNYFRDACGALRSGYGHAFVVARQEGFLRPHPSLAKLADCGHPGRIHHIGSLIALREIVLAP